MTVFCDHFYTSDYSDAWHTRPFHPSPPFHFDYSLSLIDLHMESAYFLFHGRYDNFGCINKLTLTNCSFDFPTSMSSDPSIYIMDCLFGVGVGVRMDFGSFIMIVEREGECTSFSSTISLLFGGMNGGIEVILLTLKHSNLNSSHLFHPSRILF